MKMPSIIPFRVAILSSVRAFPIAMLGGAVAVAALSAGAAQAQEAPATPAAPSAQAPAASQSAQVEEVVITARDRAEKAQDVPLPISAIGAQRAEREHIENWRDVAQRVPSFTPAVANPRTGANGLRGITGISGTATGADGAEGEVGVIQDNVFFTHIGFSWLTQYDVESIQVARGPQGTLLGKNTTLGTVIINTKEPSFEPQTTTETTFGSRYLMEEKITNTGTLVPDTLAYRVALFGARQDGYIRPLYDQSAPWGQNVNRYGVRGQLLGNFGDWTDRLIVEHNASDEANNTWGTINEGWTKYFNGDPRAIKTNVGTFNNLYSAYAALYGGLIANRANAASYGSPWATTSTDYGSILARTTGVSNQADYHWGDKTITSISAYRHFDMQPKNSNGDFGINLFANNIQGYDVGVDQFSQEVRISSPTGEKFDWTAGAYFLRELVDSNRRVQLGADAVETLTLNNSGVGAANPAILNGVLSSHFGKTDVTSFAQYAQGSYHFDEHATLTLGLRNTYEVRNASDTGTYSGGAALPAAIAVLRPIYLNAYLSGSAFNIAGTQKSDSLAVLINPSYKFNDNITSYLTLGRGVKSGAGNTDAVPYYNANFTQIVGYQPAITAPETLYDVELGFKSNWLDNRLQVNANVYLNEIYDFQARLINFYTVGAQTLSSQYLGNIPHVRLAGFEADGRYSAFENFWITWTAAYNGAWYVQYPNAAPPIDLVSEPNGPKAINLSGVPMPGVTPFSFSLGGVYEYHAGHFIDQDWKGYVYANQFFKSATQFTLGYAYTNLVEKQGAYSIINLGSGVKTADEKFGAEIWAKNLFNTKALTNVILPTSNIVGFTTVSWVDPLTVGVTLRTKF